jgi:hypothetical protein
MKKAILCLCCLCGWMFLKAQSDMNGTIESQRNLDAVSKGGTQSMVRTFDNRYEGVRGTPYLYPKFYLADVWLVNSKEPKKLPVRYNVHLSELEFQIQGKIQAIPLANLKQFVLTDEQLENRLFLVTSLALADGSQTESILVEKLYEDGCLLYKESMKRLVEANYEGAYSPNRRADEFRDRDRYYLRTQAEGTFTKIRISRGQVLKTLQDQKDALKRYIRQEAMRMDSESDLLEILAYYDQLKQ